jgi:hypothetical protein
MLIALCAGRVTSAMIPHQHALCAVRSIQTCAWPSMQNRYRKVHPANAGEFGAHCQTFAESSRLCSMCLLYSKFSWELADLRTCTLHVSKFYLPCLILPKLIYYTLNISKIYLSSPDLTKI